MASLMVSQHNWSSQKNLVNFGLNVKQNTVRTVNNEKKDHIKDMQMYLILCLDLTQTGHSTCLWTFSLVSRLLLLLFFFLSKNQMSVIRTLEKQDRHQTPKSASMTKCIAAGNIDSRGEGNIDR